METGFGAFVSPDFDIADSVVIGAHAQLIGRGTIGPGVRIGHGAVIEGEAHIGAGCTIGHHVLLSGRVTLGEQNDVGHGSTLGGPPEHPDHLHSNGRIHIGKRNVFRERCTVNMPTTEPLTTIGDDNYFMHGVHVAHDCAVSNHIKIAPLSTLAGHVRIADYAYLGLHTAIHQRRDVGAHCMIGMSSAVVKHIPPFATLVANRFSKVNAVGLALRGFSAAEIALIEAEYGFSRAVEPVAPDASNAIREIRNFLASHDPAQTYLPAATPQ